MTTTRIAVRTHAAGLSARIMTNQLDVSESVVRYFRPWWRADLEPINLGAADVNVHALVDHELHKDIVMTVDGVSHETISYAHKELRVARNAEAIAAYSEDGMAYTVADQSIAIAGINPGPVGAAACRLAREGMRSELARDGWVLLHASAVVDHQGQARLAFGTKGSGKTSAALQLARVTGGALLANDRVFAGLDAAGTVVLLPWPAVAAVGLGLLDAAGWYDVVAAARNELHPSTTAAVRDALARGDRQALRQAVREHKVHLYPDQLTSLLGLALATRATAGALIFPSVRPDAAPAVRPGGREIGLDDAFASVDDHHYPDVFQLREPEEDAARDALFQALNALPRWTVSLSHDVSSNLTALAEAWQ